MCVKFYISTMRSDQCGTYGQFWSCDILETYDNTLPQNTLISLNFCTSLGFVEWKQLGICVKFYLFTMDSD